MNKPELLSQRNQGTGRRTRREGGGRSKRIDRSDANKPVPHAPQNRHLLILTGAAGSGKSHLLERWKALAGSRMVLMDPLNSSVLHNFPENDDLEMVAIDHADWLQDAPVYVRTISNWAQKRGVLLILAVERESWLHNKGIALPKDPIHLTLDGQGGERGVFFNYMGHSMYVSREEIEEITTTRGGDDAEVEPGEEPAEE